MPGPQRHVERLEDQAPGSPGHPLTTGQRLKDAVSTSKAARTGAVGLPVTPEIIAHRRAHARGSAGGARSLSKVEIVDGTQHG